MSVESLLTDPIKFQHLCWPHITLFDKQEEILRSLHDNVETFVHAGNELGKDFVSAIACLWFFASRSPCYVVTTSSNAHQLQVVLWGEMRRMLAESKYKFPFEVTHMRIRRYQKDGSIEPQSEIMGKVVQKGESFQGFHLLQDIPRTLCLFDEASAIDDTFYDAATSWAHRILVIGNPMNNLNFFYRGCKKGDLTDPAQAKETKHEIFTN